MAPARRKTLATQQLLSDLRGNNQTAAITAALEMAREQMAWDASFSQRLHQKYQEIDALAPQRQRADLGPVPRPIKGVGLENYTPYGKFDPYKLLEAYGRDQLRAVLVHATQRRLREAVGIVQEHEPHTQPANRTRNADMVDYIVEQVAGAGY
jgi:hypothetical protein